MKQSFFLRNARAIFYTLWFSLTLFQAVFTQLQDDEAYYWVYSKFLDWGYFDHPPMIALMIKVGTLFFGHHLGVRLLPVLFNILTLLVTEKLLARKEPLLYYALCASLL